MRRVKKILYRVVMILLGITLAAVMYLAVIQRLTGEQVPEIFGIRQAVAVSGSMEPVFSPGDLIIYRESASYQVGDVILFRQEESLITHRIVGEHEGQFLTKGDANNTTDKEMASYESILGKMVLVLPHAGSVILFLRSPFGILILLGSALALTWMPHRKKGGPDGK